MYIDVSKYFGIGSHEKIYKTFKEKGFDTSTDYIIFRHRKNMAFYLNIKNFIGSSDRDGFLQLSFIDMERPGTKLNYCFSGISQKDIESALAFYKKYDILMKNI